MSGRKNKKGDLRTYKRQRQCGCIVLQGTEGATLRHVLAQSDAPTITSILSSWFIHTFLTPRSSINLSQPGATSEQCSDAETSADSPYPFLTARSSASASLPLLGQPVSPPLPHPPQPPLPPPPLPAELLPVCHLQLYALSSVQSL